MINEMEDAPYCAMLAGFAYEKYAANELAAGASQGLVLKKMEAEEGTTTFFLPNEGDQIHQIGSPFNQRRERRAFSSRLKFDIPHGECLSDYFWLPMAPNNPLFNAFVIEFNGSAPNINAVVWILQMTLGPLHGGSPNGYSIIRSIKKKVQEAMGTTGRRKVTVGYVFVSPQAGRWKLPKTDRRSCVGDVYYQRVGGSLDC
jgi:hypothetical protein